MAITWNRKLPVVAMVNNPALVYLQTDNHPYNVGSKYEYYLDLISTWPANNDVLVFDFNGTLVTFTFKTTPDSSGTQIKVRTTENFFTYLNLIRNSIIQNYDIASNYLVDLYNDGTLHIRFTALNKGAKWAIAQSESASNFTWSENIIGTDDEYYDYFQLMLQVWKGDGGSTTDVLLGEDRAAPDNTGAAVFDIAKYLQPEVSVGFHYPEQESVYWYSWGSALIQYFIRYAEVKNIPPVVQAVSLQTGLYALVGKKPDWVFDDEYRNQVDSGSWDSSYRNYFNMERAFLTNQPGYKRIAKYQPEKLWFVNWSTETSLNIRYTVYYTDGTYLQNDLTFTTSQYQVHELSIGPDWLNVHILGPGTVVSYTVVIVDSSGPPTERSEMQTYFFDYGPYKTERMFLFKNQRGGYDTLCFRGIRQRGTSVAADTIIKAGAAGNPFELQKRQRFSITDANTLRISSGPLTEVELDHYREVLLTEELYMIIDGKLHDCLITTDNVENLKTDNEYTYQLTIQVVTDYVEADIEYYQNNDDARTQIYNVVPGNPQVD